MRARLAAAGMWPVLSHQFGLRPWDVGRLTRVELASYEASARAWLDARRQHAASQPQRPRR